MIVDVLSNNKVLNIIAHFFKRLKETPLLLGYIIIQLVITYMLDGFGGLNVILKNLILLFIWALIIRIMTEETPQSVKIKNAKLELFIGFIFVVYLFIFAIFSFFNKDILSIHKFLINYFLSHNLSLKMPIKLLSNAIENTIFLTIPMILIYLLMGYKFKEIGFRRVYWKLTFILLGLTILLGICWGFYYRKIDYKLLVISYIIEIFINGLPEELIFRGFLLSRLEKVLNNSLNALVISALIFNIMHIPSMVFQYNYSILNAFLSIFNVIQPTGLIWGYLYLRTRSIIPGMLWHTSFGTLGIIFF